MPAKPQLTTFGPGFTAENALGPATRTYATSRRGASRFGGVLVPQAAPVSGMVVGTFCIGGVWTVVAVDIDENGNVRERYVDEIGSCA